MLLMATLQLEVECHLIEFGVGQELADGKLLRLDAAGIGGDSLLAIGQKPHVGIYLSQVGADTSGGRQVI